MYLEITVGDWGLATWTDRITDYRICFKFCFVQNFKCDITFLFWFDFRINFLTRYKVEPTRGINNTVHGEFRMRFIPYHKLSDVLTQTKEQINGGKKTMLITEIHFRVNKMVNAHSDTVG